MSPFAPRKQRHFRGAKGDYTTLPVPTQSASEGTAYGPRWRFGFVSHSTACRRNHAHEVSMVHRNILIPLIPLALALGIPGWTAEAAERLPNFVIILIDDMGYADIGAFGGTELPNAAPRPHGEGRPRLYRFLRDAGRLFRIPGRTDDRLLQRACRDPGGAGPPGRLWHQCPRNDAGRGGQAEGIRHRLLWQMAPGPSSEIPSHKSRIRRVPRPSLLERYVAAAPPGRQVFPGSAAHRGDAGHQPQTHRRGPESTDDPLHGACGPVHREEQGPAFLGLLTAHDGPRARCTSRRSSAARAPGGCSATR